MHNTVSRSIANPGRIRANPFSLRIVANCESTTQLQSTFHPFNPRAPQPALLHITIHASCHICAGGGIQALHETSRSYRVKQFAHPNSKRLKFLQHVLHRIGRRRGTIPFHGSLVVRRTKRRFRELYWDALFDTKRGEAVLLRIW